MTAGAHRISDALPFVFFILFAVLLFKSLAQSLRELIGA